MIQNKEPFCGLTAHSIVGNKIDEGDILVQNKYPLTVKTDSELRKFLSIKVHTLLDALLEKYPNFDPLKSSYSESYYKSFYKIYPDYQIQPYE